MLKQGMPPKKHTGYPCAECFGSLGVESRIQIFRFLSSGGKKSVSDIVEHVKLTQPTVSYHLKAMKKAGILCSEKQGKTVLYHVNKECALLKKPCILNNFKFPEE